MDKTITNPILIQVSHNKQYEMHYICDRDPDIIFMQLIETDTERAPLSIYGSNRELIGDLYMNSTLKKYLEDKFNEKTLIVENIYSRYRGFPWPLRFNYDPDKLIRINEYLLNKTKTHFFLGKSIWLSVTSYENILFVMFYNLNVIKPQFTKSITLNKATKLSDTILNYDIHKISGKFMCFSFSFRNPDEIKNLLAN